MKRNKEESKFQKGKKGNIFQQAGSSIINPAGMGLGILSGINAKAAKVNPKSGQYVIRESATTQKKTQGKLKDFSAFPKKKSRYKSVSQAPHEETYVFEGYGAKGNTPKKQEEVKREQDPSASRSRSPQERQHVVEMIQPKASIHEEYQDSTPLNNKSYGYSFVQNKGQEKNALEKAYGDYEKGGFIKKRNGTRGLAERLERLGGKDTELVHINKDEEQMLDSLIGRKASRNRTTKLKQYR